MGRFDEVHVIGLGTLQTKSLFCELTRYTVVDSKLYFEGFMYTPDKWIHKEVKYTGSILAYDDNCENYYTLLFDRGNVTIRPFNDGEVILLEEA